MNAREVSRYATLVQWVQDRLSERDIRIEPLAGDASVRRYFRVVRSSGASLVVVDIHPAVEAQDHFVAIDRTLGALGVCVPAIHHHDLVNGFLLLSDFGDTLYSDQLNEASADDLYQNAFNTLLRLQSCKTVNEWRLPYFDRDLYTQELNLFRHWFLNRLLGRTLTGDENALLHDVFERLINAAQAQPQVFVHRDYHSRNLVLLENGDVGVLDFQDAVWGPVTYDVVSLLRDAYIDWPDERVQRWARQYYKKARKAGVFGDIDYECYQRWFDWMGLQRHLKILGIFSRLYLRDGKSRYLHDIPRVLGYVFDVSRRYPEFSPFYTFLKRQLLTS